jgi:hypothetical protein
MSNHPTTATTPRCSCGRTAADGVEIVDLRQNTALAVQVATPYENYLCSGCVSTRQANLLARGTQGGLPTAPGFNTQKL